MKKHLIRLDYACPIVNGVMPNVEGQTIPIEYIDVHYSIVGINESHYVKRLYSISDVEMNMGYARHGWIQFKGYEHAVRYRGSKFSDTQSVLPALSNHLIRQYRHSKKFQRNEVFIEHFKDVLSERLEKKPGLWDITLEEVGLLLETISEKRSIEIVREEDYLTLNALDVQKELEKDHQNNPKIEREPDESKTVNQNEPVQMDLRFVDDNPTTASLSADKIISLGETLKKEAGLSIMEAALSKKIALLQKERDSIRSEIKQAREQIKKLKVELISNVEPEMSGQIETLQSEIKSLHEKIMQTTFKRMA
jgi:hypothetical protein